MLGEWITPTLVILRPSWYCLTQSIEPYFGALAPILVLYGAFGAHTTYRNSTDGAGGARNTSKSHEKSTQMTPHHRYWENLYYPRHCTGYVRVTPHP